jgi:hypothetical protein
MEANIMTSVKTIHAGTVTAGVLALTGGLACGGGMCYGNGCQR